MNRYKTREGYIYAISWDIPGIECPIKIGVTTGIDLRLEQHVCSSPFPLVVHAVWLCEPGDIRQQEQGIHAQLERHRMRGEWFLREPTLQFLEANSDRFENYKKFLRRERQRGALQPQDLEKGIAARELLNSARETGELQKLKQELQEIPEPPKPPAREVRKLQKMQKAQKQHELLQESMAGRYTKKRREIRLLKRQTP